MSDVLTQRFKFFLYLDEFKIEEVMETVLLDYLAPDWMKTVNTFREVFSLIQGVIACKHYVPYNNEKAFLTLVKYLFNNSTMFKTCAIMPL